MAKKKTLRKRASRLAERVRALDVVARGVLTLYQEHPEHVPAALLDAVDAAGYETWRQTEGGSLTGEPMGWVSQAGGGKWVMRTAAPGS